MDEQERQNLDFFIKHEKDFTFSPVKEMPKEEYSVIIVSRNRCPYPELEYLKNPLVWAAISVVEQKIKPKEFVLVNDCSSKPARDFTTENSKIISRMCKQKGISFIYKLNKKRENAAISRNLGANLASTEALLFMDDDAILRSETCFAIHLFSLLVESDPKFFILNLPLTTRTSHPLILVPKSEIGRIDETNLKITSGLITRFPKEYLPTPPKVRIGGFEVIEPIILQNFQAGSVMMKKSILKKLGGFQDYGSPIVYGEETGLALTAVKSGYTIYYFPYLNLSGIHFSYGNPSGRQEFLGNDFLESSKRKGLNLVNMVKESLPQRIHSGMRVQKEIYYYVKIRNFGIILDQYRSGLLDLWAQKSYDDFVASNEPTFQDNKGSITDREIRKKIWRAAINGAKNNSSLGEKELLNYLKG